jgi:hypothetical protein
MNPDDTKFREVLRAARPSPSLPPHFHESVWRRIEDAEASVKSDTWLDALAALVSRPRFALVAATMLVMTGVLLGAREGNRMAQKDAKAQYITAVAPVTMR